ncbi:RNA-binding protein [Algivirga pacifica]|uniref:RNA-binding protein n=1 Tax=Algivirga pacifica TaxID=1162670 RepID=A0ABP9D5P8_9BACT
MKVFVSKLHFRTSESDLKAAFQSFGAVKNVKIEMDPNTGRSKGFAYVEMEDKSAAEQAIASLNGTELDGRDIAVKEAVTEENIDAYKDSFNA